MLKDYIATGCVVCATLVSDWLRSVPRLDAGQRLTMGRDHILPQHREVGVNQVFTSPPNLFCSLNKTAGSFADTVSLRC